MYKDRQVEDDLIVEQSESQLSKLELIKEMNNIIRKLKKQIKIYTEELKNG